MAIKLKGRREKFCLAYVANGKNGKQAAIEAGYSEDSAESQASRLLRNDKVQEYISQFDQKLVQKYEVKIDKVLMGIDEIACSDLADAFDDENRLLPVKDIPPHIRRCIASIKVEALKGWNEDGRKVTIGTTTEIRLWPKTKAQEMLGRHLKMFTDKVEHSGTVSIADAMKLARERAKNGKK